MKNDVDNARRALTLSRLEISGVRGIGWTGRGPGLVIEEFADVTILSGPNGLGKSSVMDALRLALMGDVRKIGKSLEWRHLCHRRGPTASTFANDISPRSVNVRLRFTDDSSLSWHADIEAQQAGAAQAAREAAAELLRQEGNGLSSKIEGDAVADHLRLTHFLPQGWGDRFTDLDDTKDGWALIERALGVEGLRGAVTAAQGARGVNGTLNSLMRQAKEAVKEAETETANWRAAVTAWRGARTAATASGAMDESAVRALLSEVSAPLAVDIAAEPDGGIVRVQQALATELAVNEARRTQLTMAQPLVEAWSSLVHSVASATDAQVSATAVAASCVDANRTALEHVRLAELWVVRLQLPELVGRAAAAVEQYRAAESEMNGIKAQHQARALDELADRAEALVAAIAAVDKDSAAIPDDLALRTRLAGARARQAELKVEQDAAAALLARQQVNHSDLLRLLLQLRPHVDGTHDVCPVCTAKYDAGELLHRLDSSLKALGDDTASETAAGAHRAARELEVTTVAVSAAQAALDARLAEVERVREARAALSEQEQELRRDLPGDLPDTAMIQLPDGLRAAAESQRRVATHASLDRSGLDASVLRASRALSFAAVTMDERRREVEESTARVGELGASAVGAPPDLEVARVRLIEAQHTYAATMSAVREATDDLALAQRDATTATAARDRALAAWRNVPMEGEPDPGGLAAAYERLRRKDEQALRWSATLQTARNGASAWKTQGEERRAQKQLIVLYQQAYSESRDRPSAPSPFTEAWADGVTRTLEARCAELAGEARACEERAKKFAKIITSFSSVLTTAGKEILPEIMRRQHAFQQVLAPGVPWNLGATAVNSKLGMHAQAVPAIDGGPPAAQVPTISRLLSEGEHTAVALSFLLAFHTRFRWSRWPALLLDDPFQAADVVRVASLLDVLRSVALHEGTQLVLTTHDVDRARWIARKMKNGGLTVAHYTLGMGPGGVFASRA